MNATTNRRWFLGSLAMAGALSACGRKGSQGPKSLEPEEGYAAALTVDTRPLIPRVSAMRVETTPSGVIVLATGVAPGPGFWDAELVPQRRAAGSSDLRLAFRMRPPREPVAGGSEKSRELTAARTLSAAQLEGVTSITVVGAVESRTSRR